jgi:predicted Zn-dependent peptidase
MQVVLKQRTHARNVAVRLAVNVGFWDFPCATSQLPHLLEHLYFAGTSTHSEEELDALIQRHGGTWNATTDPERTIYEIDILSDRLDVALETLHEILTDSTMTEEQIADAKDVVMRELGGESTALSRWLAPHGFGQNGWDRALNAAGLTCSGIPDLSLIGAADLQAARERFYRASRMTLIVVGDTTREALDTLLAQTLGRLPAASPGEDRTAPPAPSEVQAVQSTFETLVGGESDVGFAYRVPGYLHPDYPAIRLATNYLDRQLFNRIRVQESLAYGPGAQHSTWAGAGFILAVADINVGDEARTLGLIREEIKRAAAGDIDRDALEDVRQGMLLQGVQGYEANADVADYYAASLAELGQSGRFRDEEAAYAAVTAERVADAVRNHLLPEQGIEVVAAPTLTPRSLYIFLGIATLGLIGSIWRRRRRARS